MKIVALLGIRNEESYLETCLKHLISNGIEVCIIDNESTDTTIEIANKFLGKGVIRIETLPYDGIFDLHALLVKKEELVKEIDADWFIHHDADEIRQAPKSFNNLKDGIVHVDKLGYNAIDFNEFVFMPTEENENFIGKDYVAEMKYYYYFSPRPFHRINAWKKLPNVAINLTSQGGHQVNFENIKIYPEKFILRHYVSLSKKYLIKKYAYRIYPLNEIQTKGWHANRANLYEGNLILPDKSLLHNIDDSNTFDTSQPYEEHLFFKPDPNKLQEDNTLAEIPIMQAYKKDLLKEIGLENPDNILDLTIDDIYSLEENIIANPNKAIMCFDLLLNQQNRINYYILAALIIKYTRKKLIIAGYTTKPEDLEAKYYHEPIIKALERSKKFESIVKVISFGNIAIYIADVKYDPEWIKHFFQYHINDSQITIAKTCKLFLHIGLPKTATTSLQWLLYKNREKLEKYNIIYPEPNNNSYLERHQEIIEYFLTSLCCVREFFSTLINKLNKPDQTIILSAEGLTNHFPDFFNGSKNAFSALNSIIPVSVLFILRSQADFLNSYYAQILKNVPTIYIPERMSTDLTIDKLLGPTRASWLMNYRGIIKEWLSILGKQDNIHLFVYSKNIIPEIFSWLVGENHDISLALHENSSLPPACVDILNIYNHSFPSLEIRTSFIDHFMKLSLSKIKEDTPFLTSDEKNYIVEKYKKDNEWIESNFDIPKGRLNNPEKRYYPIGYSLNTKEREQVLFDYCCNLLNETHQLDKNLNEQSNQLSKTFDTIEQLKIKNQILQNEYNKIIHSKSWKLTEPLRIIIQTIKYCINKTKHNYHRTSGVQS